MHPYDNPTKVTGVTETDGFTPRMDLTQTVYFTSQVRTAMLQAAFSQLFFTREYCSPLATRGQPEAKNS